MTRIQTGKPCTENWYTMTPDEQGAFCSSCQKNVVDFTQKSTAEIRAFFNENAGKKICGRIEKTQLDKINSDYAAWENQTHFVFQSKFVLALFLVFGLNLFSCKGPEQIVEIPATENAFPESDSVYVPLNSVQVEPSIDTVKPEELYATPETLKYKMELPPGTLIDPIYPITLDPSSYLGAMWYFPPEENTEAKTALILDYKLPSNELENLLNPPSFSVEPFPVFTATGTEELIITTFSENTLSVLIRDQQGKLIKEIHQGMATSGKHPFEINLAGYKPGLYFICIEHGTCQKLLPLQLGDTSI